MQGQDLVDTSTKMWEICRPNIDIDQPRLISGDLPRRKLGLTSGSLCPLIMGSAKSFVTSLRVPPWQSGLPCRVFLLVHGAQVCCLLRSARVFLAKYPFFLPKRTMYKAFASTSWIPSPDRWLSLLSLRLYIFTPQLNGGEIRYSLRRRFNTYSGPEL